MKKFKNYPYEVQCLPHAGGRYQGFVSGKSGLVIHTTKIKETEASAEMDCEDWIAGHVDKRKKNWNEINEKLLDIVPFIVLALVLIFNFLLGLK